MLKKLGKGMSAGDEKKKLRTRTKQRIGNEATDRAGTKFRTLVIDPECTWCSCHSPGTVSGNFMARRVPELVPAKSIRPERDITHCVNTISLAGTSRRICGQRMFQVMFHFR